MMNWAEPTLLLLLLLLVRVLLLLLGMPPDSKLDRTLPRQST